MSINLYLMYHV